MRNRNISEMVFILGLSLAFLAFSATAQTSSPQTTPSDQAPQATSPEQPQTEPSQQSPTATPAPEPQQPQSSPSQSAPASPSTASPSPSSPSQSTPPGQSSPSASGQQGNQPSIDDQLQLTPDQKQKIAAVVDDENRQIGTVRDDNSMSMQQKQQKVMQIRQAGTPKIKAILTPEQLQKLAAIQQKMRDQQTGNQGTSQPQPQH
jgi:Spy/CpxP family protein refolding chaperone